MAAVTWWREDRAEAGGWGLDIPRLQCLICSMGTQHVHRGSAERPQQVTAAVATWHSASM
jgi:hypothetical protein